MHSKLGVNIAVISIMEDLTLFIFTFYSFNNLFESIVQELSDQISLKTVATVTLIRILPTSADLALL